MKKTIIKTLFSALALARCITMQAGPSPCDFAVIGTYGGLNSPRGLAYAPSGNFLAVANFFADLSLYSANSSTGTLNPITGPGSTNFCIGIAYHPSGKYAALTTDSMRIIIYATDQSTGAFTGPIQTVPGPASYFSYSSNGKFAIATSLFQNKAVFYTVDQQTGFLTDVSGGISISQPQKAVFSTDNTRVIVPTNVNQQLVYSVDQLTGAPTLLYTNTLRSLNAFSFSPDGLYVAALHNTNKKVNVYSFNAATGQLTFANNVDTGNNPSFITYSSDGTLAAVSNASNDTIMIYGVNQTDGSFTELTDRGSPVTVGDFPRAIVFSPNNDFIAVVNANANSISIIRVPDLAAVTLATAVANASGIITATGSGAQAGASITVRAGSIVLGTGTADGSGNFSIVATRPLIVGTYSIQATQTVLGCQSIASNNISVTITPQAVVLSSAAADASTLVTTIGGGAQAGATITVTAQSATGSTVVGTGTADSSGNFTIVASTSLAAGVYAITATQTVSSMTSQPSNSVAVSIGGSLSSFITRLIEKYFMQSLA